MYNARRTKALGSNIKAEDLKTPGYRDIAVAKEKLVNPGYDGTGFDAGKRVIPVIDRRLGDYYHIDHILGRRPLRFT